MNAAAGLPLVHKILGGKGGGGTYLTQEGEKAIDVYYRLQDEVDKFSKEISKLLAF